MLIYNIANFIKNRSGFIFVKTISEKISGNIVDIASIFKTISIMSIL